MENLICCTYTLRKHVLSYFNLQALAAAFKGTMITDNNYCMTCDLHYKDILNPKFCLLFLWCCMHQEFTLMVFSLT